MFPGEGKAKMSVEEQMDRMRGGRRAAPLRDKRRVCSSQPAPPTPAPGLGLQAARALGPTDAAWRPLALPPPGMGSLSRRGLREEEASAGVGQDGPKPGNWETWGSFSHPGQKTYRSKLFVCLFLCFEKNNSQKEMP